MAFAKRGCSVAVHYNSSKAKADTVVSDLRTLGVNATAFQADLSEYDNVRKLHADVVQQMGHPDILFNNSGITNSVIGAQGDIESVSIEEYENTWRVNAGSSYLVSGNHC